MTQHAHPWKYGDTLCGDCRVKLATVRDEDTALCTECSAERLRAEREAAA